MFPIDNLQKPQRRRGRLKTHVTAANAPPPFCPQLYSCGSNVDGRLGLGGNDESCRTKLTPLEFLRCGDDDNKGHWKTLREEEYDDNDNDDKNDDAEKIDDCHNLSSGRAHTLMCHEGGEVYGWGGNDHGQLGSSDDGGKPAFEPRLVAGGIGTGRLLSGVHISSVACGYNHSLLVSSTGLLFSFGSNDYGELGQGDTCPYRHTPLPINHSLSPTPFFVSAAGGLRHTLALTIDGSVYSFGRGNEGQLGNGISSSRDHVCTTPRRVTGGGIASQPVLLIAASRGGNASYAVTLDGYGWHWGTTIPDSTPVTIPAPLPPPLGSPHAFVPSNAATANVNTANTEGTNTTAADHTMPSLIPSKTCLFCPGAIPPSTTATHPSSAAQHSPTMTTPHSHLLSHLAPPSPPSHRIISLSAGHSHLIIVTLSGEAYALGTPGAKLGLGPGNDVLWKTPSKLLLPGNVLINGVCCGCDHTVLTTTAGRVFVCGDGRWGKLGLEGESLEVAGGREAVAREVFMGGGGRTGQRSEFVGEGTWGCKMILSRLKENEGESNEAAATAATISSPADGKSPPNVAGTAVNVHTSGAIIDDGFDSFEDDEDYWGEEGLGHELEMDFNMGNHTPFGAGTGPTTLAAETSCGSWKSRLSSETVRRRLSRGTSLAGGVGGAIFNTVVTGIKNRVRGESTSSADDSDMGGSAAAVGGGSGGKGRMEKDGFVVGSVDSHQDSFDGLAGRPRRKISLSAGVSHTCVRIIDGLDGD